MDPVMDALVSALQKRLQQLQEAAVAGLPDFSAYQKLVGQHAELARTLDMIRELEARYSD